MPNVIVMGHCDIALMEQLQVSYGYTTALKEVNDLFYSNGINDIVKIAYDTLFNINVCSLARMGSDFEAMLNWKEDFYEKTQDMLQSYVSDFHMDNCVAVDLSQLVMRCTEVVIRAILPSYSVYVKYIQKNTGITWRVVMVHVSLNKNILSWTVELKPVVIRGFL